MGTEVNALFFMKTRALKPYLTFQEYDLVLLMFNVPYPPTYKLGSIVTPVCFDCVTVLCLFRLVI